MTLFQFLYVASFGQWLGILILMIVSGVILEVVLSFVVDMITAFRK